MLRKLYLGFFITLLALTDAHASHIMGGSVCYQFLSYNSQTNMYRYKFFAEIYRDPTGIALPTSYTFSIYNNNPPAYDLETTVTLNEVNVNLLTFNNFVGPNCTLQLPFPVETEVHKYEGEVDLPPTLLGYHVMEDDCCRNPTIDNLTPSEGFTFYSFVPASFYENNSPCFVDDPILFVCKGVPWTISNRAVDPDGDLLFYRLITPYDNDFTPPLDDTVTYQSPFYSGQHPFGQTSSITINSSNGVTTILADSLGIYVVAVEVQEYRNGFLLSSSIRDMQMAVIDCQGENPAELIGDSIVTSTGQSIPYTGGTNIVLNINEGDSLCFTLPFYDPDGDSIRVNFSGGIFNAQPPAILTLNYITQADIEAEFCWITQCGQARTVPYVGSIDVENIGGCPQSTTPYKVIVYVNPYDLGPGNISGPDTLCANTSGVGYVVNDTATNYSYQWFVDGGTLSSSSGDSAVVDWGGTSNVGTVSVERSLNCHKDTLDYTVYLLPAPLAAVDTPANLCEGDTITLDASNSSGTTFEWSPNTDISNVFSQSPQVWPANNTTYLLVVNNGGICEPDTMEVEVEVFQYPVITMSPDTTICAGDAAGLRAQSDPSFNYSWQPSATLDNSNISMPSATPQDTTQYNVWVTNSGGCTTEDSVEVRVNNPRVDVGPVDTFTICQGDTFIPVVTAHLPQTITWTPSTDLSNANVLNPEMYPNSLGYHEYEITVVDQFSCVDKDTLWIEVVNTKLVAVAGDTSMCEGSDSVELVATGGTVYEWSPAIGLSHTDIFNPMAAPAATQVYQVIVNSASGNCQGDTTTMTLTVHAAPVLDAGPNETRCSDDPPTQLNATGGFVNYQWSPSVSLNDPSIANPQTATKQTRWYYVSIEDINGCTATDSLEVTVNSVPVSITPGDTISFCGDDIQLQASPTGGNYSYNWFPSSPLSDPTISNPVASSKTSVSYIVTVTDNVTSCTGKDTVLVAALSTIDVSIDTPSVRICAGESVELTGSVSAQFVTISDITWSPAAGLSTTQGPITTASPTSAGDHVYVLTGRYNDCSETAQVTVTVIDSPVLFIAARDTICYQEQLDLTAAGDQGLSYQWNTNPEDTQQVVSMVPPVPGVFHYEVTGTNDDGCVTTAEKEVEVIAIPDIDAGENQSILEGESVEIPAEISNYASLTWVPFTGLDDPNKERPVASPAQTTMYYVHVLNAAGCEYIDSVEVEVNPRSHLRAPLAFSPNGDGKNEQFTIRAEGFENPELRIYNRWGEVVFYANTLEAIRQGWDGTYRGKKQPIGTYVWTFTGENKDAKANTSHGSISLIR